MRARRAGCLPSVRTHLLVLVLASTLPILAFALAMLMRYGQAQEAAAHAQMLTTSRALALALTREVRSAQTVLLVLSQRQSLRQHDFDRFHERCQQAAAEFGPQARISLVGRNGQILNTRVPIGTPLPSVPAFGQQVLQTDRPMVSGIYRSPMGDLVVSIGVPVHTSRSAEPDYGLVLVLPVARFSALLREQQLPGGWLSSIVDDDGIIVARSPLPERFVGEPAHPDYLAHVRQRDEGLVQTVSLDGQGVHGAFTRVPGTSWTVGVAAEPRHVLRPMAAALRESALGGAALIGLATLGTLLVARRIARPMQDLVQAAQAVGGGATVRTHEAGRLQETRAVADVLASSAERIAEALRAEHEASDRLRELAATLEQRVAERTHELAEANQAKSDFLAHMSHEIRTPLTGVLGLCDLMATEPLPEPQRRRLALLRSSAQALQQLLTGVLDLAKIEAGKLVLEAVAFDPAALVREAVALFVDAAQGKGLAVTLQCERLPERCVGDPTRLRQVLLNLLSNAVKFTERGRIEVRAWSTEDGARLHVRVRDTGIGLPAALRERVFQAFVQADSSITRRYGGTGLGLVICRRLVDAMGGRIDADAAPDGPGTVFEFDVPVLTAQDIGLQSPHAEQLPALFEAGVCARLLLAEDDATNRTLIAAMLEHMGHVVDAVPDGRAALQAVERADYDLVLTDVRMPGLDGTTLLARIRTLPAPKGAVPVVALTADAARAGAVAGRFDAWVVKPIDWQGLHRVIQARLASGVEQAPGQGAREPL